MSEITYSEQEINDTWNDLNAAKKELEELEHKNEEPKKELIIRIRDRVDILVKAKKILIRENQISDKVKSILNDVGVSYSKGHWYELFLDHQKRNYSIAPEGEIHQHSFKIVTSTPNGTWEQCKCGTNRLNGIEQMDLSSESQEESTKNQSVRETVQPEGIQFDYLKLKKEELTLAIDTINALMQKCTLDVTSIKKQTINKPGRTIPQIQYEKLFNETKLLVDGRVQVVIEEFSNLTTSKLDKTKTSIADLKNAIKKLNDRTKITDYEKATAKILIEKFGYFIGDIANILNITTKHVKNNILKQNVKSIHDQDSMLEQLNFMVRCPGCGLGTADYHQNRYEIYKKGKPITEDFELESYPFPTFAKQVIQLKQQVRKKIIQLQEKNTQIELLKIKIKSK